MSLTIITKRERVYPTLTERFFEEKACPGAGYAFECDKDGTFDSMSDAAQENLKRLLAEQELPESQRKYIDHGVRTEELAPYSVPAVGRCSCGSEVVLDNALTNECACGLAYNMSGQRVQAPSDYSFDDVVEECWSDVHHGIAGETDDVTLGADMRYA